jgi:hypothetical protein
VSKRGFLGTPSTPRKGSVRRISDGGSRHAVGLHGCLSSMPTCWERGLNADAAAIVISNLMQAKLGQLTVVRSEVVHNQAMNTGGGIWTRGELSLIDVVFADNSPDDVASG